MNKITRLIVADDNPRARDGLRAILSTQPGIEIVAEASQGDEVLDLVEVLLPDVVLLDIRMPGMDGIQTARSIKAHWPWIRVVLISIYDECQDEALSSADVFLIKGCPAEELISVVMGTETAEHEHRLTCKE